jgi:hypothetical protein
MKQLVNYILLIVLFLELTTTVGAQNKTTVTAENNTVCVLWRGDNSPENATREGSELFLNNEYLASISESEKAALAYVATFVGNDCDWEGEAKPDRSNLRCKLISALELGCQCSATHLNFLRRWFRNDSNALERLNDCPTIPFTATKQTTFDKINISSSKNNIVVYFEASGINTREEKSWEWDETCYFELHNNHIKLVNRKVSEPDINDF